MEVHCQEGAGAALLFSSTKRMLGRVRLADCLCIGRIVLTALKARLYVARRHEPNLVAERDQLARSMAPSRTDQAQSEPS